MTVEEEFDALISGERELDTTSELIYIDFRPQEKDMSVDSDGRPLGTRWYWESVKGWHGPLTEESARKAANRYGIGTEIRPYKTYGLSQEVKDQIAAFDAELEEAEARMTPEERTAELNAALRRMARTQDQVVLPMKRYSDGSYRKS